LDTKGLKYFVYAKYASNAYSGGAVLGKAMKASASYTFDNGEVYADDALQDTDKRFVEGKLTYSIYGMTEAGAADILGHTPSSPNDGFTANYNDISPFVGTGFYGLTAGGKYKAVFYTKVQFSDANEDMETRKKTVSYNDPSVEGTIMRDDDGDWKLTQIFTLESDAIAWLNTQCGISVTASAGLSALSLAGTGGTISPAFGAAIRYYTFGGMSGTSFTVTPTAAAHTIKLYVNDTYVQDIVSGAASAAVTIALGTKKVKLVAYESGKSSQTTEIVVVKTT